MSNVETVLQNRRGFTVDVTLEDPTTGDIRELPFLVDTGSPDAIALPTKYDGSFLRKIGTRKRGGTTGGGILADVYAVRVKQIGELDIDHTTACIFSITRDIDRGLLGVDLLNYLVAKIYDDPDDKKMDLEPEYL